MCVSAACSSTNTFAIPKACVQIIDKIHRFYISFQIYFKNKYHSFQNYYLAIDAFRLCNQKLRLTPLF